MKDISTTTRARVRNDGLWPGAFFDQNERWGIIITDNFFCQGKVTFLPILAQLRTHGGSDPDGFRENLREEKILADHFFVKNSVNLIRIKHI